MQLEQHILGTLFYLTEPTHKKTLAEILNVSLEELSHGIATLKKNLSESGIRVLETVRDVQLVTAPEIAPIIDAIRKDTLARDIGKAGAETLAIILYQGKASRARVDSIRGVHSGAIIRSLLVRGLVERVQEKNEDGRAPLYTATAQLLTYLGVTDRGALADFDNVMTVLESFVDQEEKELCKETN